MYKYIWRLYSLYIHLLYQNTIHQHLNIINLIIMKHQAQNLVNCFLSSDFSEYTGAGSSSFSGTETNLYHFDTAFAYFNDGEILIYNSFKTPVIMEVLNLFPEITASFKNGQMFINGIEWDGKKTKLSIFKN